MAVEVSMEAVDRALRAFVLAGGEAAGLGHYRVRTVFEFLTDTPAATMAALVVGRVDAVLEAALRSDPG